MAMYADGAVTLAEGDARAALGSLRSAGRTGKTWKRRTTALGARLIGQACRALGDEDTAEMELDAARWVFQELGAAPDLAGAEAVHAACGNGTAACRCGGAGAAAGCRCKTNRAIADELFLSEKTVHAI